MYRVLITTSGVGGRLGEYTKYTNKALIRIGKKPVIAHIIESYPKNTHFFITLGYFGQQVQDFLNLAFPDRKFTFIKIDKYKGEGSSLGYSLLKVSGKLKSPFIFHASDTLIFDKIPEPSENWIGGYKGLGSSNYTSFNILNGKIQRIMEKGIMDPDFLHIGLVGIKDYEKFWKALKNLYLKNKKNQSLADVDVLNKMIDDSQSFKIKEFENWYDTGNVDSLSITQKKFHSFQNLDKAGESIFFFNKFVIKFFHDENLVRDKVKRALVLRNITPRVLQSKGSFYKYSFVVGDLYSNVANPKNFEEFLNWCKVKLWKQEKEVSKEEFRKICLDFYKNKTEERINLFFKKYGLKDQKNIINGELVPSMKDILKEVDFDLLSEADQRGFHGDLILDNIVKNSKNFMLLDWRQNFGGLYKSGDMYYDLAKLNHNLIINHNIINQDLYKINISNKKVEIDLYRRENLVQCQQVLLNFLIKNNLSVKKVNILTPLIWINSSPLHHNPYGLFLFYFGKYTLWKTINEKQK